MKVTKSAVCTSIWIDLSDIGFDEPQTGPGDINESLDVSQCSSQVISL